MISRNFLNHLTRILCLLSLSYSVYCSRGFNIHASMLVERNKSVPSIQDPIKLEIFDHKIVPWLRQTGKLSCQEICSIKLESLNRLVNPQLPPLFSDSKRLFELVELLIDNDFVEIASVVLKYMRSAVFSFSTYKSLLGSLRLDNLTVFNQILKLWFPKIVDIIALIRHLVDLRMGEDEVIEIIDLTWDKITAESSEEYIKDNFVGILGSAMLRQYVSVFEDILERLPDLITYTHAKIEYKTTIVHFFCRGTDPQSLNKLKIVGSSRREESAPQVTYYDHLTRAYDTANNDLLDIMIKYGANINAYDADYFTPLHRAIESKNAHIVQVLIDAGADANISYCGGMAPIHLAVESKNIDIIQAVIRGGAHLNSLNGDRMTPLHRAISLKRADIVQILLEAGADYTLTHLGRNIHYLVYIDYSQEVESVVNEFLTCFRDSRSRSISSS